MIYDDDRGSTQFNDISDEDLRRRRASRTKPAKPPSDAARERIIEVARMNPRWDEERIHAYLRHRRHDIPLEAVRQVMAASRRAGRRR